MIDVIKCCWRYCVTSKMYKCAALHTFTAVNIDNFVNSRELDRRKKCVCRHVDLGIRFESRNAKVRDSNFDSDLQFEDLLLVTRLEINSSSVSLFHLLFDNPQESRIMHSSSNTCYRLPCLLSFSFEALELQSTVAANYNNA